MRRSLALLMMLLAGCVTDPEEREVVFPKGDPAQACERPAPSPALARGAPMVVSSGFRPEGPGRAVESARLVGGIRLLIRHESCERSSQQFRFYLPKPEAAPASPSAAYARAAGLLRGAAAPGKDGEALRALAEPLEAAAAKGKGAPPLGTRLEQGEFQESMLSIQPAPEGSAYATVLVLNYRLKL